MVNFDDVIKENIKKQSSRQNINNGSSGSGRTNSLFNVISRY